jgi:hypothetical protein
MRVRIKLDVKKLSIKFVGLHPKAKRECIFRLSMKNCRCTVGSVGCLDMVIWTVAMVLTMSRIFSMVARWMHRLSTNI